jgi:hypothetical protein
VYIPATFFVPSSNTFELFSTGTGFVTTLTGQDMGFH